MYSLTHGFKETCKDLNPTMLDARTHNIRSNHISNMLVDEPTQGKSKTRQHEQKVRKHIVIWVNMVIRIHAGRISSYSCYTHTKAYK